MGVEITSVPTLSVMVSGFPFWPVDGSSVGKKPQMPFRTCIGSLQFVQELHPAPFPFGIIVQPAGQVSKHLSVSLHVYTAADAFPAAAASIAMAPIKIFADSLMTSII